LTKLDFALTWCIINIIDESSMSNTVWAANPDINKAPESYYMLFEDYPFHHAMMKDWKKRKTKSVYTLEGDEKRIYDDYLFSETEFKRTPEAAQAASRAMEKYVVSFSFSNFGGLQTVGDVPLSDANLDILSRFGKVFDLTYTRFNDLKQAEAQARESQIQLALERVRARTMAMQKSDELKYAATLLFQQAKALGVPAYSCGYNIWEKGEKEFTSWMSTQDGSDINGVPNIPLTEDANFIRYVKSKQNGEPFFVLELRGKRMQEHYEYLKTIPAFKGYFDYAVSVGFDLPETQIHHIANFSQGNLLFITLEPCPEFHDVFKRFAVVFEQTYTRFLDLQKAEAQAREAKIEVALERARTQSMVMQHSTELDNTLRVFHEQVLLLGIHSAFSFLWLPDGNKDRHIFWAAWAENNSTLFKSKAIDYPLDRNEPATAQCLIDWKSNEPVVSYHVPPTSVKDYFAAWSELIAGVEELKPENFSDGLYYVEAFMKYGCFGVMVKNALPEDEKKILGRFAIEFERTYTRFLDLQKAEAQSREANIELGLERVRARAMAMQNSDELSGLVAILFEELVKLDLILARCIIWIFDTDTLAARVWMANSEDKRNAESYFIKRLDHPYYDAILKGWKERNPKWVYDLRGKNKRSIDKLLLNETELAHLPDAVKAGILSSEHTIISGSFNNFGLIEASGPVAHSEEQLEILNRFGKVFDLSYTRFNDLKQAEAQAREAQIEAALERVRSRSMGMQKSEELKEVIQVVYEQFVHLNIHVEHTGFVMDYKARDDYDIWIADQLGVPSHVTIPYFDCVYYNHFNEAKKKGQDFFTTNLDFEEKNRFYQKIIEYVPGLPEETKEFLFSIPGLAASTVLLENVGLYIENFAGIPYSDEENNTLMRFGKVFQQTYTRFLDLQKAEAQAREAIRQASLDRVRGQIASMRSTDDLQRITPLIWHELTTLDVPFIRCGVLIIDETKAEAHIYLSSPDGHSLAAMNLPLQSNTLTANSVEYWRKGLVYMEHWDKEDFIHWMQSMIEQGQVQNTETYQGAAKPPESLHLHFVPFTQGMLYVGNTTLLTDDEIDLVKSLAEAFSIAYARYEDFTKLEKAKQSIEVTLTELKATQTQLIQSEKMASLGELTAGIAHEIQNPLNFVNNFSEVSKELLDEMKEELDKGNTADAKEIAEDVIQNLEKINHHGKRADAIVKGMLQHSRSSTGVKEPTDINALADEYLRLAFHGLRAKDKSFNANMKTDYDATLEKVNVIPQDIGRVILNLITNAFYAVTEKAKQQPNGYEPTISVSSKKLDDKIFISVKDNGGGIPQKVVDKIFQPFFTTKPTGQGTGLGLSLSYDIVKAHGGEIKVETKEGEGSEFIIQLPIV
jgi:signal transduction histidine kinase